MSFNKALIDYLKSNKLSSESIEARRIQCGSCDRRSEALGVDYCSLCMCKLEGKLGKLQAPREKCPLNKW